MSESDVDRVAEGYDAVYAALPHSPTFRQIWREYALGVDYPESFEHISFLTLAEMREMARDVRVTTGWVLVDLACGMGGPGLWIARESGARLIGVDISAVALAHARERAVQLHVSDAAQFKLGAFADTGLESGSVDSVMSVDALQYAPSKQAAMDEAARVLRGGGRFVFAAFELEPGRVAGVPVIGADPVADYRPLLEQAGFRVLSYSESVNWHERVTATYRAVIDAKADLVREMGGAACQALLGEMTLTLQLQPYRRRVLVTAERESGRARRT